MSLSPSPHRQPEDNSDPVLDPDAINRLLRVVDGNQEVIVVLIDTFLEDAPGLIETMRQGTETQDVEAVRRAAHTLKSNSADFGAKKLSMLCRQLEDSAKSRNLSDASAIAAEISVAYEPVASALAEMRDDSSVDSA